MKQKKKRAEKYEPLVKTNLSFDELLKISAHTSLKETKKKSVKKKKVKKKK